MRTPGIAPTIALATALLFAAAIPARAVSSTTIGTLSVTTVTAPPPLDPKADVSAWSAITPVTLAWDVQHERPASELTTAGLATDGKFVYARFDVKQREGLLQNQHTNNVGDGTDDEVWVDLWPSGNKGFYYQFAATSNGTHFQYSSENTAYEPTWESYGKAYAGGFTVTMKIPINVMRGTGSAADWKAQFVRVVRSTGERQIWSYAPAQSNGDDVTFAGSLSGMAAAGLAARRSRVSASTRSARRGRPLPASRRRAWAPISQSRSRKRLRSSAPSIRISRTSKSIRRRFLRRPSSATTRSSGRSSRRPTTISTTSIATRARTSANLYSPNIPTPRDAYASAAIKASSNSPPSTRSERGASMPRSRSATRHPTTTGVISWNASRPIASPRQRRTCQFDAPVVHDDTFANGL
jgi:hypothetical protein